MNKNLIKSYKTVIKDLKKECRCKKKDWNPLCYECMCGRLAEELEFVLNVCLIAKK